MFHYTRCITPKRVTSLLGQSLRHCAQATQLLLKKCREVASHCQHNLTDPRFEPQTSRSRDKRVIARPTDRLSTINDMPLN